MGAFPLLMNRMKEKCQSKRTFHKKQKIGTELICYEACRHVRKEASLQLYWYEGYLQKTDKNGLY